MPFVVVLLSYFKWHYSRALSDAFSIWGNFVLFVYHYFAVSQLFRTIFEPWRRMTEYYAGGFDPAKFFEALIINAVMRVLGLIIKSFFIGLAFLSEIFIAVFGAIFIAAWLAAPFIVFFSVVLSFYYFAAYF